MTNRKPHAYYDDTILANVTSAIYVKATVSVGWRIKQYL